MNLIEIRLLESSELDKIYQINRSEESEHRYCYIDGELNVLDEPLTITADAKFWDNHFEEWKRALESGAEAFGAFDDETLSGIVILDPNLAPGTERILALYVDLNHRLSGIAKSLYLKAQDAAKSRDSHTLYVCATPTDSSINFYLSQGFEPTSDPHQKLLEQHPNDIHMTKRL